MKCFALALAGTVVAIYLVAWLSLLYEGPL